MPEPRQVTPEGNETREEFLDHPRRWYAREWHQRYNRSRGEGLPPVVPLADAHYTHAAVEELKWMIDSRLRGVATLEIAVEFHPDFTSTTVVYYLLLQDGSTLCHGTSRPREFPPDELMAFVAILENPK